MKIIEISDRNQSKDGTDYLVQIQLTDEETQNVVENNGHWKESIDSAVVHCWIDRNGKIASMDLSLFDGDGGYEDCICIEKSFTAENIEEVKAYVMTAVEKEEQGQMSQWKTQAEVAAIRKRYPVGSRIALDYMNEQGMPPGLKGIVDHIDDQGQLHMIWENGRSLALIPGADRFHRLPELQREVMPEHGAGQEDMER